MASIPSTEPELDELLSHPRPATVEALRAAPGDVVVLGAGGKMGPTLARMVARAAEQADGAKRRRVIAVSRFSAAGAESALHEAGVETIRCDLLDRRAVDRLPEAPNVIYMAGQKFGTTEAPSRTWMHNVVVPALCAARYERSRIVAFSTGNVYPLVPVASGGATEATPVAPVGEYAASCVGRERVFEHYAAARGTRVAIVRLNYAIDLRYGVLVDLAMAILDERPIPLAMGHVNVIWQGDANRAAIELLPLAATPPLVVNVTGGEVLAVQDLARELARRLDREARFDGNPARDALLSDTTRMRSLLAAPEMRAETMLDLVAEWMRAGRPLLGKPTHFETRDGAF
ncbi:MAG: NAD(P)-dependent oxidoreductase [Gemmatimonadaceae bacterium]|nr:NAD(P)-dependent oxidoreductase [Gemmatimonadaceae bacterium]NUQ94661.1 NAD(P)-dependent oxidoreductase [Gemmatimonadaceae bacterium]NUR18893.1 NAD(P)-dependent oxidoreductase [Gemmatimonadaceae bacterium]NUS96621.1 NAD(P)-dependent oxidoreductase [Gemmatimonadaceae bacterium]